MRFSELLTGAQLGDVRRRGEAEVRRVVMDSRRAREGDCFVAVRGTATDGHRYIASAVAAGCTAVVCQEAAAVPRDIAHAVVQDSRAAVAALAQASLGWPCRRLCITGVTGTNGKTTFAYLLRSILQAGGSRVGLIGTICYDTIAASSPAGTTTPDPVELAAMMAEIVAAGGTHLVMEVSSHALDQGRVAAIDLDVGVFTNLTGDHLDYHGSIEDYLSAKRRMFESLPAGATAVINRDDEYGEEMASATKAKVLWYGLSPAADLYCARVIGIDAGGSRFVVRYEGEEAAVRTALIGRHNICNCLAAAAAAAALGVHLDAIAAALAEVEVVPGRLQRVEVDAPFDVLVDYAHTHDALRNVLSALGPVKKGGRLILVFGAGGDRDRTKRPRMAEEAERGADSIIVTSDNPRTEDPLAIIREIMAGFSRACRDRVRVEPDRRKAIAAAIEAADPGDVVLIAGKGHEDYQVLGTRRVHFDDVETAEGFLRQRSF